MSRRCRKPREEGFLQDGYFGASGRERSRDTEYADPRGYPESTASARRDTMKVYELSRRLEIHSAFDPFCEPDSTSGRAIVPHHVKPNRTRNTSAPRSFFTTAAVRGFQMC